MDRSSPSYQLGFAFGCVLTLAALFAVAIFAETPYSTVALCVVPLPLAGIVFATVARVRSGLTRIRNRRKVDNVEPG